MTDPRSKTATLVLSGVRVSSGAEKLFFMITDMTSLLLACLPAFQFILLQKAIPIEKMYSFEQEITLLDNVPINGLNF